MMEMVMTVIKVTVINSMVMTPLILVQGMVMVMMIKKLTIR